VHDSLMWIARAVNPRRQHRVGVPEQNSVAHDQPAVIAGDGGGEVPLLSLRKMLSAVETPASEQLTSSG
jgi:hypothetical protein